MPFITQAERVGIELGRKEGLKQTCDALLQGIELALDLKFGAEGLTLMERVKAQQDVEALERFLAAIKPASSLDDLRQLLPTNGQASNPT